MEKTLRIRDNVRIEVSIKVTQDVDYRHVVLTEYSEKIGGSFDLNGIRAETESMVETVSAVICKGIHNLKEFELQEAEKSNG